MFDWIQKTVRLAPVARGFHLVTREITNELPELGEFEVGWLQVFLQHTSASLTLNENADPDVRMDMETAANQLCPESTPFVHTCEGPDDMPAHVKASIFGRSSWFPFNRVNSPWEPGREFIFASTVTEVVHEASF